MSTDEKNIFLAEYMGWEKSQNSKGDEIYRVPFFRTSDDRAGWNIPAFLIFTSSWDWFQQAFQKARNEDRISTEAINIILEHFKFNEIGFACDILIEFLKEKEK